MAVNAVAVRDEQNVDWSVIHAVVTSGDLSGLNDQQKTAYYRMYCESVGVDPVTQPFAYVKLQGGKLSLYALKGAAEQLRQNRKITLRIVDQQIMDGMYVVTAEATLPDGRTDTDIGAVWLPKEASEARANAMMKAITKAKRRVTLSICGLGLNDETEVTTIPGAVLISAEGEVTHPVRELPPQRPVTPPASSLPVTRKARSIGGEVIVGEVIGAPAPNLKRLWMLARQYYGRTALDSLHEWIAVSSPNARKKDDEGVERPSLTMLTQAEVDEMVKELERGIADLAESDALKAAALVAEESHPRDATEE